MFHKTCPAFNINTIAKIMPKNDRWAKVLPPILAILLREVTTPSMTSTPKSTTTIAKETVLVVLKGEISTVGFSAVSTVKPAGSEGEIEGVAVITLGTTCEGTGVEVITGVGLAWAIGAGEIVSA